MKYVSLLLLEVKPLDGRRKAKNGTFSGGEGD